MASAAASHSLHTSGRKPLPDALFSVSSSSPRLPYQPIALARTNTSGFFSRDAIVWESRVVLLTRESRIACFLFLLHRLSPIPSPPRCMTTSNPSSSLASISPLLGVQRISLAPCLGCRLTSLQTSCPPVSKNATNCVPIIPDEPATKIRFRGRCENLACCSKSL